MKNKYKFFILTFKLKCLKMQISKLYFDICDIFLNQKFTIDLNL